MFQAVKRAATGAANAQASGAVGYAAPWTAVVGGGLQIREKKSFHRMYRRGSQYTHHEMFKFPRIPDVTRQMERLTEKAEKGSLTDEQFKRTRKPFDFPIDTREERNQKPPGPKELLMMLKTEERQRLETLPREIDDFKVGDKVAVWSLVDLESDRLEVTRGLVIDKRRKTDLDASFTIRNTSIGVAYELSYPLYSPFLRKVKIIQGSEGFKQNKLYWINRLPRAHRLNRPVQ